MIIHLHIDDVGDFTFFERLHQLPLNQAQCILRRIGLLIKLGYSLLAHATGFYQLSRIGCLMAKAIAEYIGKDNHMLNHTFTATLRQHPAITVKMT